MSGTLIRQVAEFLFGDLDDLPMVAIQIFWKLLCLSMTVLIAVEVLPHVTDVLGFAALTMIAAVFGLAGLFAKLGSP